MPSYIIISCSFCFQGWIVRHVAPRKERLNTGTKRPWTTFMAQDKAIASQYQAPIDQMTSCIRILHGGFGIILLEIISFNTLILPMRKLRPREVNSIPRKVIGRTNTWPQCSTWDPTFWTIFFVTWGNVQVFTHIHVLFLIHFYDQGNSLLWKKSVFYHCWVFLLGTKGKIVSMAVKVFICFSTWVEVAKGGQL